MDIDVRATVAGFLAALFVLAGLLVFVGVDATVDAVSMADPAILVLLPFVALAWLVSWGLSLRIVLTVVGTPISTVKAVGIYTAAVFANNVTPFGQAGGEPVTAFLIADATENRYETGLAAIASVDALNLFPSLSIAAVGLGYYAVTTTLGRQLQVASAVVGVLAVAIPVAGYVLWRRREAVENGLTRLLTSGFGAVYRLLPGRQPPTEESVRVRVDGFFHAVERVAEDRRQLVLALGFATIGWLALSTSLWLSLYALGARVPLAAALLIVPIGSIASVTPFPGGLGGIEAVLITLLVPTTGVTAATATAAVLIHRTATYWLPTVAGGGAAAWFGLDRM
ncbi:lysylphosphatidylglycerol synthase transmembrane domain-containing protein [Halomarina oriensis]|uniref:Flippase-like domain-containing protein n=1 Tax=Halomarina oriensis TaxID=671145 RepID=A0A6B0GPW4_9EURY|nr:lysylphosphatidylglycerol synthase transmembrane domain-containing protein [Halomarina oriensis]MWG33688.1 flippase-like domain-containing protein [Halomarina oriensis]